LLDPIWRDSPPLNSPWVPGTNVWRQLGAQYANAGTMFAVFNAIRRRIDEVEAGDRAAR
jgi:hypothetical protein